MASNSDLIAAVKMKPAIWDSHHIEHKNAKVVNQLWEEISKALNMETKSLKKKWRGLRDYYRSEYKRKKLLEEDGSRTLTTKLAWPYYEMMSFVEELQRQERSRSLKSIDKKEIPKPTEIVLKAETISVGSEDEDDHNVDDEDESTEEDLESDSGSSDHPLAHKKNKKGDETRTRSAEFNNSDVFTGINSSTSMPYDYRLQMLELESQKLRFLQKEEASDEDLMFLKSLLPDLKTLPGHRKTYLKLQFQQMVYNEISALQGGVGCTANSERNTTNFVGGNLTLAQNDPIEASNPLNEILSHESNYDNTEDSDTLHEGFDFNNSYESANLPLLTDVDIRNDFDDFKSRQLGGILNNEAKANFEEIYLTSSAIKNEKYTSHNKSIDAHHGQHYNARAFNATISKNLTDNLKPKVIEFTKKGEIRKRKRYEIPLHERKRIMIEKRNEKYFVKPACQNCKKNCSTIIVEARRIAINKEFWNMDSFGRKKFVLVHASRIDIGRRTNGAVSKRMNTFKYLFETETGEAKTVCRKFFLTTLGFLNSNDGFLHKILSTYKSPKTNSGKNDRTRTPASTRSSKRDRSAMKKHVESFCPNIFEEGGHATEKKYLTGDLNITIMHKDFTEKYKDIKCSYELYRLFVTKECNISFEAPLKK